MKILHNSKIMQPILSLKSFLIMARIFIFLKTWFGPLLQNKLMDLMENNESSHDMLLSELQLPVMS